MVEKKKKHGKIEKVKLRLFILAMLYVSVKITHLQNL